VLMLAGVQLPKNIRPYRGIGCEFCHNQCYKGRTGIYELIAFNDELRNLILTRPSSNQIQQKANIKSLREYGWQKVVNGETTIEEVMRVTEEEEIAGVNL